MAIPVAQKRKAFRPLALLLMAAIAIGLGGGCSGVTVQVIDPTGAPVAGAEVQCCMTHSLAVGPLITDSRGIVRIDWGTRVQWIVVTKPGHEPARCDVGRSRRLKVTLTPSLWEWEADPSFFLK